VFDFLKRKTGDSLLRSERRYGFLEQLYPLNKLEVKGRDSSHGFKMTTKGQLIFRFN
jgi:hypothetical protein